MKTFARKTWQMVSKLVSRMESRLYDSLLLNRSIAFRIYFTYRKLDNDLACTNYFRLYRFTIMTQATTVMIVFAAFIGDCVSKRYTSRCMYIFWTCHFANNNRVWKLNVAPIIFLFVHYNLVLHTCFDVVYIVFLRIRFLRIRFLRIR